MNKESNTMQHNLQMQKIGNALVYLSSHISDLTKTKLLKLVYLLDEVSIRKSGVPIFNLTYKVWKFGPVSEDLYIDLSDDLRLVKDFLKFDASTQSFKPASEFCDDEFSDNEIELMNFVIEKYGAKSAADLVSVTHHPFSPWYNTAKEHNVLEPLEQELINHTDLIIDMKQLIAHDALKLALYNEYISLSVYAS
jgi:uncharacterized phage-associated protein